MRRGRGASMLALLLVVLLMAGPVIADTYDLNDYGDVSVSGNEDGSNNVSWSGGDKETAGSKNDDTDTKITSGGGQTNHTVTLGDQATVTFDDVNIVADPGKSAVTVKGEDVTIHLEGENSVKGGDYDSKTGTSGAGINVKEGGDVTIDGDGSLDAKGGGGTYGYGSAGIGGSYNSKNPENVGNITLKGGDITATGGDGWNDANGGAGIGSASGGGDVGIITIDGADVTAQGGYGAAGIGGGYGAKGTSGLIQIDTGKLKAIGGAGDKVANGGSAGAGIGSGHAGKSGDVKINGGEVEAIGGTDSRFGYSGAGIGGGARSLDGGGTITINGGTVKAVGGSYAAAIGTGWLTYNDNPGNPDGRENADFTLTVNGGHVIADSRDGYGTAGIGGGYNGNGGTVYIIGGTVEAYGAYGGAAIGSGMTERNYKGGNQWPNTEGGLIVITGGTVKAVGGTYAAGLGGGREGNGSEIRIEGGEIEIYGGLGGAAIGGGFMGNGGDISLTGGDIYAKGGEYASAIGGGADGTRTLYKPTGVSIATPYRYLLNALGRMDLDELAAAMKAKYGGNYVGVEHVKTEAGDIYIGDVEKLIALASGERFAIDLNDGEGGYILPLPREGGNSNVLNARFEGDDAGTPAFPKGFGTVAIVLEGPNGARATLTLPEYQQIQSKLGDTFRSFAILLPVAGAYTGYADDGRVDPNAIDYPEDIYSYNSTRVGEFPVNGLFHADWLNFYERQISNPGTTPDPDPDPGSGPDPDPDPGSGSDPDPDPIPLSAPVEEEEEIPLGAPAEEEEEEEEIPLGAPKEEEEEPIPLGAPITGGASWSGIAWLMVLCSIILAVIVMRKRRKV